MNTHTMEEFMTALKFIWGAAQYNELTNMETSRFFS